MKSAAADCKTSFEMTKKLNQAKRVQRLSFMSKNTQSELEQFQKLKNLRSKAWKSQWSETGEKILEQNGQAETLQKKDIQVYNDCIKLPSRATNRSKPTTISSSRKDDRQTNHAKEDIEFLSWVKTRNLN